MKIEATFAAGINSIQDTRILVNYLSQFSAIAVKKHRGKDQHTPVKQVLFNRAFVNVEIHTYYYTRDRSVTC